MKDAVKSYNYLDRGLNTEVQEKTSALPILF